MKSAMTILVIQVLTFTCSAQTLPEDFAIAPTKAWEFRTAGPLYGDPVIINDILYVGSLDSNLYALNANTGGLKWKYKTGGDIRSSVVPDGKNIFILSGDGSLYCLSPGGQLQWKFDSGGDRKYELFSFADYFQSTPIVNGDTVFFGTGNGIYAVNKMNGTRIWDYQTGSVVHSSPAFYRDQLIAGSFDGFLYSLNRANGTLKWKFKSIGQRYFPKGEMQGSPVVYKDMVFIGSRDYNFYALDATNGYGLWNKQFTRGWAMGKPVVHNDILYVGTSDDKLLLAFDPASGAIKWQTDIKFNMFGSVAFSKSMLYIGTLMGRIYGIDTRSGKISWMLNNPLFEKNKSTYFKTDETYCDDISSVIRQNDDFLKMYYALGAIFSTPLIYHNSLYISSTDGAVYSYRMTGK